MNRITIGEKTQEEFQVLLNKLHVQAIAEIMKVTSDEETFFGLLDDIYWYGQITGEVATMRISRESYDWLELVIAEEEGREVMNSIIDRKYIELHALEGIESEDIVRAIDFGMEQTS